MRLSVLASEEFDNLHIGEITDEDRDCLEVEAVGGFLAMVPEPLLHTIALAASKDAFPAPHVFIRGAIRITTLSAGPRQKDNDPDLA